MNNKIISIKESISTSQCLRNQGKTIVVVGGFFDILHLGHIKFLQASKKYANTLFVLLEEDGKAKSKNGKRPVNSQENRAKILSAVKSVNYIVMLENMTNNQAYDKLMIKMLPNVIATTYGDPNVEHKKRQAKLVGAKVIYAIKRISDHSTTRYIKLIDTNQ